MADSIGNPWNAGYTIASGNLLADFRFNVTAAIKELEEEGLDRTPVPANFPQELEKQEVAYQFIDASEGSESQQGRWARGPSVDGKGQFTYARIEALTDDEGLLGQVDPRTYGTPASPLPAQAAE
jgi:Mn-containing catalase